MSTTPQPLSSLAQPDAVTQTTVEESLGMSADGGAPRRHMSMGMIILWFFIIAVIAWVILYFWKPQMVQTTPVNGVSTGVIDYGKLLLASVVIAVLILLIVWIVWSAM